MRTALLLLAILALCGCPAPQPIPNPQPQSFREITNGVTLVTYVDGTPDLAPDDLAQQLYKAGGRPNMTNVTIWVFDTVDTPEKRAAIDAAVLQGAKIIGVKR